MSADRELANCCTALYDHPAVQWLMGESWHPGGLRLTERVAHRMQLEPGMRVLDAGCGRGASAIHLAKSLGCSVVGVSLEGHGIEAARATAARQQVNHLTEFICADLLEAPLGSERFDAALMECALSIFPDKDAVVRSIYHVLRPGGRVGLTDVTVAGPLPDGLRGVLATAGCVGGARPLEAYGDLFVRHGFEIEELSDLPDVASGFLRDVKGKLLIAEIALKVNKLPLDPALVEMAKRLVAEAQQAVNEGSLGYGLVLARRPA
ncbi:MAG: methyltransferase domain-containing protein [Chloroflexi bacterium]|nr:methyltransferase domain-containing protein [Chloroflexota bacterium]